MVIFSAARSIEGVAGKLSSVYRDIISSCLFRMDSQVMAGLDNHLQLAVHVIAVFFCEKGKIQVSLVMEYCAAAGKPPYRMAAILQQMGDIAFLPQVLVPAADHGPLILPQIEDDFVIVHMVKQIFF